MAPKSAEAPNATELPTNKPPLAASVDTLGTPNALDIALDIAQEAPSDLTQEEASGNPAQEKEDPGNPAQEEEKDPGNDPGNPAQEEEKDPGNPAQEDPSNPAQEDPGNLAQEEEAPGDLTRASPAEQTAGDPGTLSDKTNIMADSSSVTAGGSPTKRARKSFSVARDLLRGNELALRMFDECGRTDQLAITIEQERPHLLEAVIVLLKTIKYVTEGKGVVLDLMRSAIGARFVQAHRPIVIL